MRAVALARRGVVDPDTDAINIDADQPAFWRDLASVYRSMRDKKVLAALRDEHKRIVGTELN